MAFGISFGFGSKKEKGQTIGEFERGKTERLDIEQEAVDKIISDVLGGPQGLASIFAGEQTSGIFNSSVAAQAAGDLAANLIGEIAKLRAERITQETGMEEIRSKGKTSGLSFGAGIGV